MSGFGDAIGAALGGLGRGVSMLAGKYIDEEMQQQRAQALADIQFANTKRTEEWQQSDEVQGQRLINQRKALEMQNDVSLRSKVAEASNPELRQAKIENDVAYLQGTTPAKIAAENAVTEGTAGTKLDAERIQRLVLDPMDVAKSGAIANAHYAAKELHDPKSAFERLPEAKKLEVQNIASELKDINKEMIKAQAEGGWDPAKNASQKQLEVSKAALQHRLRGILSGEEPTDVLGIFGGGAKPGPDTPKAASKDTGKKDGPSFWDQARQAFSGGSSKPAEPPPEGSPQAKWQAKQDAARAEIQGREASKNANAQARRDQFDADYKTMEPIELLRKYGDMASRSGLGVEQLKRLKALEQQLL